MIEGNHIPDDVTIQVLTQAREDLITRTFESLRGAKKAIVHVYNATAPSFRRIVFNQDKQGVVDIATNAAKLIRSWPPSNRMPSGRSSTRRKSSALPSWSSRWRSATR